MAKKGISDGVVHKISSYDDSSAPHWLPADLKKALISDPKALSAWKDITPLARNEWICWTISVKKPETRKDHVRRVVSELKEGKRRPCCWIGCRHTTTARLTHGRTHRTDKPVSPSVRGILNKRNKK